MESESSLVEGLKEYFSKTPQEQIEKDWEATKEWDEVVEESVELDAEQDVTSNKIEES